MKQRVLAAALLAAMGLSSMAPALADGKASKRNISILGTGAAILNANYVHKVRAKRAEQRAAARRQAGYREWYYRKYGYYPTQAQVNRWYQANYPH